MFNRWLLLVVLLPTFVQAASDVPVKAQTVAKAEQETKSDVPVKAQTVAKAEQETKKDTGAIPVGILQRLGQLIPGALPDRVTESALSGLYEVVLGSEVVYISEDGRFMMKGELFDLKQRKNLTENTLNKLHSQIIAKVKDDNTIIFGPKDYKHTVTVFTDLDCGYCRKLHSEMAGYTENKIRIRYLFFPRAGVDSASYNKAVSVWCSDDRKQALTNAKLGQSVPDKTCSNPVKEHLALGASIGVTGTPTIVLESGKVVPGYIPPTKLAAFLNQ